MDQNEKRPLTILKILLERGTMILFVAINQCNIDNVLHDEEKFEPGYG